MVLGENSVAISVRNPPMALKFSGPTRWTLDIYTLA